MKVTRITEDCYAVESESDADKRYLVRIEKDSAGAERFVCDCTAYAIKRNRAGGKTNGAYGHCKHCATVSVYRSEDEATDMSDVRDGLLKLARELKS